MRGDLWAAIEKAMNHPDPASVQVPEDAPENMAVNMAVPEGEEAGVLPARLRPLLALALRFAEENEEVKQYAVLGLFTGLLADHFGWLPDSECTWCTDLKDGQLLIYKLPPTEYVWMMVSEEGGT